MYNVVRSNTRMPSAGLAAKLIVALGLSMGCMSTMGVFAHGPAALPLRSQEAPFNAESHVETAIKGVTHAPSRKKKIERSQELSQWVAKHPDEVSASDVGMLANLLSDDEDAVRLWIAGALGQLGEKARSAVPQLQKALSERPCASTPATSAAAIRLALSRIGVRPVDAGCKDTFGT